MSFIDKDYFKQDINLPVSGVNNDIANVISLYEPRILKEVLGYKLYELIKSDPSTPDRLNDLINGKTYTVDQDNDVRWNGLKNTEQISLIAYYTYFNWQTNHASNTENTGETANDVELGSRVNPAQKMGSAWTKMRQLVGYYGQDILEPSLYNFLTKHINDYPEWKFKDVGRVNFLGI